MQLFASNNLSTIFKKQYIFVDNDFLNCLFKNADFFKSFISISQSGSLIYDPFIDFEFLRGIFVHRERVLRERFLALDLFIQAANHQEIYMKLQENALILSKILAINKIYSASTIDLLLMGRVITYNPDEHVIITGNKKDFPSCLFDVVEIINAYSESNNSILNFFIIKFNRKKFDKEYQKLEKLSMQE